jgi:hypothetical protein
MKIELECTLTSMYFRGRAPPDYPSFGARHVFEIVRLGALFRILLPSPSKVHSENMEKELKSLME